MNHELPRLGSAVRPFPQSQEALDLIDRHVERAMHALGIPGMAVAISGGDGLLATRNYGFSDIGAHTPVDDGTLFEFGSIGKSFTAICLLQLAGEGIVDLHAPVAEYLPWFAVHSQHAPITIHHLLTHTAGIIGGSDFPLDARNEVWALREAGAAPPGERARYSNVGYKALGLVLEAVTGNPYARIVQERILDPLAMTRTAGVITHELRRRLATGFVPFYDDRPWRLEHGLAPATWLETNTGDGCLSATASDLAVYLRMLLNGGSGPSEELLSDEAFAKLCAPHTEIAPGVPYGYGLVVSEQDGRQRIGHDGGMVGFVAAMLGDVESEIGVVVLINGMFEPAPFADFALRTVVAAHDGEPLPDLPPVIPEPDVAEFTGVFRGASGDLVVAADEGRLVLIANGERIALDPTVAPPIPDAFVVSHPDFDRFPLRFGRDATGIVVEMGHGDYWFATDAYEGTRTFETPPEWTAYPGHYRSYNPWNSNFRIVIRKGELRLAYPSGHEQMLTAAGDAFRIGDDPESPEHIAFDTVVDGKALRARLAGGADYYRFFTP